MKKLINKKNNNILLVAESKDDWDCLETLYHNGICFGAYLLYYFKEDETKTTPLYNWLVKNFPLCYGIMQISVVKGFANELER